MTGNSEAKPKARAAAAKAMPRKDGFPPIQPAPSGAHSVPASRIRAAVRKVLAARRLADAQA